MAPTSAVLLLATVTALLGTLVLTKREKVYYIDLERINVTYWNPKYYKFIKITTERYSRKDLTHYLNVHGESLGTFGNNITVNVSVYEFLSNEYRRGFVEIHIGLCDILFKEKTLSPYLKHFMPKCPVPPGVYHLENISFPNLPFLKTFPFTKGRGYCSGSVRRTGERLIDIYVDVELKERWVKN